jgi:hypothetical protein
LKLAKLLGVATVLAAVAIPFAPSKQVSAATAPALLPIGTVVPHVALPGGGILASIPCLGSYVLRLPDGLTGAAAAAYASANAAAAQFIPCARTTELGGTLPPATTAGLSASAQSALTVKFNAAQAAYNAAVDQGATVTEALAKASTTYSSPVASNALTTPPAPLVCNGGNWHQNNYDTVLDMYGGVKGHINWQIWYSVANGGGCNQFFGQTSFAFVNGSNIWLCWSGVTANYGSSYFATVGHYNNPGGYDNIPVTYNYNNASTTGTSLRVDTLYCTDLSFGSCDLTSPHQNAITN